VITKSRNAAQNWVVYHKSVGTSNYLRLNTIDSQIAYGGFINPTSTQVFYGGLSELNTNGNTYVSYLFSEVSGYSAFGSYTGNGSADGPFIYTGFRPRFILMKSSSHNAHWTMMDSSRSTYNVAKENLFPNLTSAENTSNGDFDFLSNGFKPRSVVLNETNGSGMTYIYAAFAEHPFKYSRAR
jgi:hypothetical protein